MRFLQLPAFLAAYLAVRDSQPVFNPRIYERQIATCQAFNRNEGRNVDLDIHYVDLNPKAERTLLFVHGWPSLWSSWSNQIQHFQNDYHLVIPDLRGFGASTHPGDVHTSGMMGDLVGDLACVLDHARVSSATCVGHDWGAQICYEAARMRPDIFNAVVGITVPYVPAADAFLPIENIVSVLPCLTYQLFFERQTDAAIAELDDDKRRTLRATLRTVESPPPADFLQSRDSFLGSWANVSEIPPIPFFTSDEEDYFVEQYSIQGFKHTLQLYTHGNRYGSWDFANKQGNHTIHQPVLSLLPLNDPVADWIVLTKLLKSADYIPQLTTEVLAGAHWVHLENPQEANAIIQKWLDATFDSHSATHVTGEL